MERHSRARTETGAFLLIVGLSLIALNALARQAFHVRVDMTKRRLYSLSDGTRRTLHRLHDQLTVTAYWSPDQPAPANDDERLLREQLDEYAAAGNGNVVVRFVHPDNDERRHAAESAGCPEETMQAVDVQAQQANVRRVFRCLTFEYLRHNEKIERVEVGVEGMEYQVTSIIKKMIDPERAIGFLTGHEEAAPDQAMPYLSRILTESHLGYTTRAVDLHGGDEAVPTDIKGLIILNPTHRIEDRELRRLDAYLMSGGSVAVFAGGATITGDDSHPTGAVAEHHLNDWLHGYGITINPDVVLDPRSGDAVVRLNERLARLKVLTFPVFTHVEGAARNQDGLDPSHNAVFRLPLLTVPYAATLTLDPGGTGHSESCAGDFANNVCRRVFLNTSELATTQRDTFDLDVVELNMRARSLFGATHAVRPVGVSLEGRLRSAYAGSAPPAPAAGATATPPPAVPAAATRDARLMVVSSGKLFNMDQLRAISQIQGGTPTNIQMLLDTFDWLSADYDLLAVRAKTVSEPELRGDISDTKKQIFQWGSIVGLPLLVGVLGIVLTQLRARRRALLKP